MDQDSKANMSCGASDEDKTRSVGASHGGVMNMGSAGSKAFAKRWKIRKRMFRWGCGSIYLAVTYFFLLYHRSSHHLKVREAFSGIGDILS
jgi:hypothetical protein